jgi:hypothetical protein
MPKNGYYEVPQKPGLGVELKDGLAELYPAIPEGNYDRPDPDMPPPPAGGRAGALGRGPITNDWPSRPGARTAVQGPPPPPRK